MENPSHNKSYCEECLCKSVCQFKETYPDILKDVDALAEKYGWPFNVDVSCLGFRRNHGNIRGGLG